MCFFHGHRGRARFLEVNLREKSLYSMQSSRIPKQVVKSTKVLHSFFPPILVVQNDDFLFPVGYLWFPWSVKNPHHQTRINLGSKIQLYRYTL